jgi:hypothetical protein
MQKSRCPDDDTNQKPGDLPEEAAERNIVAKTTILHVCSKERPVSRGSF